MAGLAGMLPCFLVGSGRKAVIRFPEITETGAAQKSIRQFAPQAFARGHAAVPDKEGKDVFIRPVLGNPNEYLLEFQQHIRKYFVYLHHRLGRLRGRNTGFEGR